MLKSSKLLKNGKIGCLILNTIKGKGLKVMENKPAWHYWNPLDSNETVKYLKELKDKYE